MNIPASKAVHRYCLSWGLFSTVVTLIWFRVPRLNGDNIISRHYRLPKGPRGQKGYKSTHAWGEERTLILNHESTLCNKIESEVSLLQDLQTTPPRTLPHGTPIGGEAVWIVFVGSRIGSWVWILLASFAASQIIYYRVKKCYPFCFDR